MINRQVDIPNAPEGDKSIPKQWDELVEKLRKDIGEDLI